MNLVAIRISAMGDVALTLPAIRSVLDAHPELTVTMVTQKQFLPFFEGVERLHVVTADIRGRHKGIPGLWRLFRELVTDARPDAVVDLHDVLRSHVLSFFFRISGKPVYRIDKGRQEKSELTRKRHKRLRPLRHSVERYLDVFARAELPATLGERNSWFFPYPSPDRFLASKEVLPRSGPWVGVAPFARHREKRWPLEKAEVLLDSLTAAGVEVFLFGGGAAETDALKTLAHGRAHVVVTAGELTLREELGLIRQLDVMVTMDSANMHMAALSGTPTVSVWGATHSFAGFGPLGGNEKRIVQIPVERLGCRPCSVFGNVPCYRGDHACMEWIAPGDVLEKISRVLEHPGDSGAPDNAR
jgi:ADP-heptose:LPS heptosyltransferase